MRLSNTLRPQHSTLSIARTHRSTAPTHQSRHRDRTWIRDLQCTFQLHAHRHPKDLFSTPASIPPLQLGSLLVTSSHLNTHLVPWGHRLSHMDISLIRHDMLSQRRHHQVQLPGPSTSLHCRTLPQVHNQIGSQSTRSMLPRSDHMATLLSANSTCMILRVH